MNPSSISRLALVVSVVGLALALITTFTAHGEDRRSAKGTEPDSPTWAEDAARRSQALAAEMEALRAELASLREAVNRGALGPRTFAQGENKREPIEALTPEARAATSPAGFELRRHLIETFHDLEREDRQDAIDRLAELARWGDAEAKALIVESLEDESADVRAQALKELAKLDESNLPAYLHQSITDPSHKVREVVASRLAKLPPEEAGPLLVDLLRDPDPDVVIEAIQSLVDLEYTEARPVLVEQLESSSLDVATRAAQALMKQGDPAAAGSTIERILADFAKDDISGRINNVKRLRRLRAVNPLERILASDPSLAVREEARDALAKIED